MADPRTRLSDAAYLSHVSVDGQRLLAAATVDLAAAVPACPGWTARDLLDHVALVYLHRVACIRDGRAPRRPDEWPPPRDETPSEDLFRQALAAILAELVSRDRDVYAAGFWRQDPSVGFWYRRMAHETLIHRVDAEQAAAQATASEPGEPAVPAETPVDQDLALDGIDEILLVFLAGDWSDRPVATAAGSTVTVRSAGHAWRVVLEPKAVAVTPGRGGAPADATVEGDPVDVLLWLWGRADAAPLSVTGSGEVVAALRDRLVLATQ